MTYSRTIAAVPQPCLRPSNFRAGDRVRLRPDQPEPIPIPSRDLATDRGTVVDDPCLITGLVMVRWDYAPASPAVILAEALELEARP